METKNNKVGIFETVENGRIVKSSTRINVFLMLLVSVAYLGYSVYNYYQIIYFSLEMVKINPAFEGSMIALIQSMKIVDLGLFTLLMLSWIAPKAIAKYAENKLK